MWRDGSCNPHEYLSSISVEGLKSCLQPVPRMRMLYHSQPGPMSHDTGIFYLIRLISFVQLCIAKLCSPSCFATDFFNNPSLLSVSPIPGLTHSNSFTSHPSLRPLSESWVRPVSSWGVPLPLFHPLPPSSSHHQSIPPFGKDEECKGAFQA